MVATSRTAALQARRTKLAAWLTTAEATYLDLLSKGIKSYMFVGGEGSQQATRISLGELKKIIDDTQREIEAIDSRLNGGGVIGLCVSRR
jgi:hypothetical protein